MNENVILAIAAVASAIFAGVAVVVGPWASHRQAIATMRQAWINNLRDDVADLSSRAMYYYFTRHNDRSEVDYLRLAFLEHKIALMLNLEEADHNALVQHIQIMLRAVRQTPVDNKLFDDSHFGVLETSRRILKREWDRVKDDGWLTALTKTMKTQSCCRDQAR